MKRIIILFFGVLCLMVLLFGSCRGKRQSAAEYYKISGERFHTYYHITYQGAEGMEKSIDSVFEVFNHAANPFDSTSLLARINNNLSDESNAILDTILRRSFDISRATGGAYDVTCSPLINAWGFGFEQGVEVTQSVIDSLKTFIGYQMITSEPGRITKADERMKIDLSSISKGYCTDMVAERLRREDVRNYLVEIGGEMAFDGVNPKGDAWHVGINKPLPDSTGLEQEIEMVIMLTGKGGLATSGNYRNYKMIDNRRMGHTIDPVSGRPVQTDVLSATVIAPDCMTADGLATALMVVGSARADELITQFSNVAYLLIVSNEQGDGYRVITNKAFDAYIAPSKKI